MKANLNEVDPLRIRMIGAIFWAVLLVYLIPRWFQHPVAFSPDGMKPSGVMVADVDSTQVTTVGNDTKTTTSAVEPRSELYIDKPLTTTPPPADPARVQALNQPLTVREVQVDQQGRLSVASAEQRLAMSPAPPTAADGHYWVQIATYKLETIALETQQKIRAQGFVGRINLTKNKKGHTIYVLRVGPYKSQADANQAKAIVDAALKTKSLVLKK
ncbi:MAG: SPOR domain-containing protein [Gammaproteobacteria bacterium]|nr:SPOR domain-containing protein [Gammaproteobacteria bacterium]